MIKLRLAMLWIFHSFFMSAHAVCWTWEPGMVDKFSAGVVMHEKLLFIPIPEGGYPMEIALIIAALLVGVPSLLACLLFILKDKFNRKLNIFWGITFTIFNIYHMTPECFSWGHAKVTTISQIIIAAVITWYAWIWKVEETA